jgi:hypothetical protein
MKQDTEFHSGPRSEVARRPSSPPPRMKTHRVPAEILHLRPIILPGIFFSRSRRLTTSRLTPSVKAASSMVSHSDLGDVGIALQV